MRLLKFLKSIDQSLSSRTSGALLIFTVKSTLNYTCLFRPSKKKTKKKHLDPDQTLLFATSDQDLQGLGINLSNVGLTKRKSS